MISLWKWLFLILLFPLFAFGQSLKERFYGAHVGDYIVTLQAKNYSLLRVHSLKTHSLVLEEITIPEDAYKNSLNWKEWAAKGAPGHTSWVLYEIDLETNRLIKCYSKMKMAQIYPEEADYLFPKFLSLPLRPVREDERKKVGPPPQDGEADRRKIWNPTLTIDGKKISKPQFEVLQARWPNDESPLSSCLIEFYLDQSRPFPFPYWIEIKSSHYAFKVRVVDSGSYEQAH
ncbi:MAG TPA: hypothetical protein VLG76_07685 [Rhabdochlamydiaceae bacterium]|nr:hypothetical protein [Rhabdochlamydiaceae bacterium]